MNHPDVPLFKACPFGHQGGKVPGGRIRKVVGDRFCLDPDNPKHLVVLSDCLTCKWHGSGETPPPQRPKVGDVLADIIEKKFKQTIKTTCDCASHIADMNNWGPDGCEENINTIVGWLVEGAKSAGDIRGLAPKWAAGIVLKPLIMEAVKTVRDWTPAVVISAAAGS